MIYTKLFDIGKLNLNWIILSKQANINGSKKIKDF